MDNEMLGAMIPMVVFKKEIFDFVESLVKEKMSKVQEKQLLTIEEASKVLNVKVSWIRQAIFRREINHIKVGALVRFREEDLHRYIKQNLKAVDES